MSFLRFLFPAKYARKLHEFLTPINVFNTYSSATNKSQNLLKQVSSNSILHEFSSKNIKNYGTAASLETQQYALHKLTKGPSTQVSITKEEALKFYQHMMTIRRMETACNHLYTEKLIRGFCHLYNGQEAVCVGIHSALRPQDIVITAYRCHGWTYIMGVDILGILAELTGRTSGCSRGKGGSMHLYGKNFYGGNGIVGAQVPLGVGLGFRQKYINNGGVAVAVYGDGAANQGQVFEVYNIAKLWQLPVIFICENNLYAMGTSVERGSASHEFYTRGDYIPGIKVDGMDVLAMREVTKFAVDYVLKNGPIVLEAVTYRYHGHSMSDPGTSYRKHKEVQEVRHTRDPITLFRDKIMKLKLATEDEFKKVDVEAKNTVDAAVKKSLTEKEPEVKELTYDIYAKNLATNVRNNLPWNPLEHKNISKAVNLK